METPYQHIRPVLWGGIECSIIRCGGSYRDQLGEVGHYYRDGDLEQIAALNVKALRYPILWEHHQPSEDTNIDWQWSEKQLNVLRNKNINPIVGLMHHGSGPAFTNLGDKQFPSLFASYARTVAQKFPWIEYYCPINEPLTTARFSGLYGHWYPHEKSDLAFLTFLLHELKATILALRAIREINPAAKFIQTEDITKIHATQPLAYQAEFENNRRWLSLDLLYGRVCKGHPMWEYLLWAGVSEEDLSFFQDNPCGPDIIGLNYYVTSERFLDDRIHLYDKKLHGGNGKHIYADVEAVRILEPDGLRILIDDTWKRYNMPIVISEAHIHCTREEQLRWFREIWDTAQRAAEDGVAIKAVTAWALLGAYDWDSLVTKNHGNYQSGVFDCKNHTMRKTALVKMLSSIGRGDCWDHPVLEDKGWWHQPDRFIIEPAMTPNPLRKLNKHIKHKIVIIGSKTSIGATCRRLCENRRLSYEIISEYEFNETDINLLDQHKPWAIINADTDVYFNEEVNTSVYKSVRENKMKALARYCANTGIQLLSFSSHLVFDGRKNTPYTENDDISPLNFLGYCYAEEEQLLLTEYPGALVARTCLGFGPTDGKDYVHQLLTTLDRKQNAYAFDGGLITPTYYPDAANTALDLLIDEASGIWHLANNTLISWSDFAKEIAFRKGYSSDCIKSVSDSKILHDEFFSPNSALKSIKGVSLPELDDALDRFFMTI